MTSTASGVILSLVLIGACLLLAKACRGSLGAEKARKIVHIGVSNWFFIYYFLIEKDLWAIIGLAVFSILNLLLAKDEGRVGLFVYPLSVVVMIGIVNLGFGTREAIGCGLLGMGYGDGLAALCGMKWGRKTISEKTGKTWAGSLAMLVVCAVVSASMFLLAGHKATILLAGKALAVSVVATLAESVSPSGLDNLTVPLSAFFLFGVLS